MAPRGRLRGGGRARGRVAALRAEALSLHGGAEAKAAALRNAKAVTGEVAKAVVMAPEEGLVEPLGASVGVGAEEAQEEAQE